MKKRLLLSLLLVLSHVINAQSFINIGSTKDEVKQAQGEPIAVESYGEAGEEIWRFGESGIASVTFKNGKIKGYNNYDQVLKIGKISKKKESDKKPTSNEDLWKKLENGKPYVPKSPDANGRDITGLYGSSTQDVKSFPPEYEEMAKEKGLNPYETNEDDLEMLQKEYENERYIKYTLIGLGILLLGLFITKLGKKKTNSNSSE